MAKKGLGRGLEALLADNDIKDEGGRGITMLKLSDIEPNRKQARRTFDETALLELSDSIKQHGLLQPIAVRRRENGYYEIIAGERRWRASKIAGLSEIPAVIREADDLLATELSLIENLQREDLNAAEEARGYRDLMERFSFTQEEAAERVGKSRTAVANLLRILRLPEDVLALLENGSLSYGHARALLPLCRVFSDADVKKKADYVVSSGISVRQAENLVKSLVGEAGKSNVGRTAVKDAYYVKLESDICDILGRKASIRNKSDGKGQITIPFSDTNDLEELIKQLCGKEFFNN